MSGDRLILAAILATLLVPDVAGPHPLDQIGRAIGPAIAWLMSLALFLAVAAIYDRPHQKDPA